MDKFLKFLNVHGNLTLIVVLAIILLIVLFNNKLRRLAARYIPLAEDGALVKTFKTSTLNFVNKVQDSDMDDRLVEVIAAIIQAIPFLRIIPNVILTKFLRGIVQSTFNVIKPALDVNKGNLTLVSNTNDITTHGAKITDEEISQFLGETFDSVADQLFKITNSKLDLVQDEISKLNSNKEIKKADLDKVLELVEDLKK